jgi:hypothetical protein
VKLELIFFNDYIEIICVTGVIANIAGETISATRITETHYVAFEGGQ